MTQPHTDIVNGAEINYHPRKANHQTRNSGKVKPGVTVAATNRDRETHVNKCCVLCVDFLYCAVVYISWCKLCIYSRKMGYLWVISCARILMVY